MPVPQISIVSNTPLTPGGDYEIISALSSFGDIAQLVERLNGIEKVRGSTPLISTIKGDWASVPFFVSTGGGKLEATQGAVQAKCREAKEVET